MNEETLNTELNMAEVSNVSAEVEEQSANSEENKVKRYITYVPSIEMAFVETLNYKKGLPRYFWELADIITGKILTEMQVLEEIRILRLQGLPANHKLVPIRPQVLIPVEVLKDYDEDSNPFVDICYTWENGVTLYHNKIPVIMPPHTIGKEHQHQCF